MSTTPGTIAKLATAVRIAARGLATGWRLALLEHYLAIPGREHRVRQLLAGSGTHLLVACMPKSGSSFFSAALASAAGFRAQTLGWGFEQNEQDLYLPLLVRHYRENTVTQQHMRGSDPNLRLIEAFGMTPIVLVRSLPDIAVSLFDHLSHYSRKASMAFVNERYDSLAPAAQVDFIVDLFMPWYISFYVSWREAERTGKCRPIWLRYEDMIEDPASTIVRVLAQCGIPVSREQAAAAAEQGMGGKIRFNKGVAGRGQSFLSDAQRGRIAALTRHYPGIDFSAILPGAGG